MSYRNRIRVARVALLLAGLVGAVAFSGVAGAQEVAIDSVSVTLIGHDATMGELARLLVEWNAKLSVRRMEHISAADILRSNGTGTLRIWVLMVPGWGAKIYLSDPSGKRYLRREVPLGAGLDESGREMLAQVIATAANAFVERRESSSAAEIESSLREDASSMLRYAEPLRWYGRLALHGTVTTHNRASVSSDTPSWHAYSGAFYAVRAVGAAQVAHGPGIMLGAAQTGTVWQWQTALAAQYELPMEIVTSEATLQLRTWSVGVNIACDRTQPSHLVLGIETGVSLSYTTYGLSSVSRSSIEALPDAAHYRPMAYVGARTGYDWGALRLRMRLGSEVALQKTHYDITERPLFTPWLLTPRLAVELAWL
ncbi:MAG TPA: hypothetical protein VKP30_06630 [Polyangiaceae bacterium]|nr:hypothetical protein [Polyangiaceae bacterium]